MRVSVSDNETLENLAHPLCSFLQPSLQFLGLCCLEDFADQLFHSSARVFRFRQFRPGPAGDQADDVVAVR